MDYIVNYDKIIVREHEIKQAVAEWIERKRRDEGLPPVILRRLIGAEDPVIEFEYERSPTGIRNPTKVVAAAHVSRASVNQK